MQALRSSAAIVRVDDDWCRAIAGRLKQAGRPVETISAAAGTGGAYWADGKLYRAGCFQVADLACIGTRPSVKCRRRTSRSRI